MTSIHTSTPISHELMKSEQVFRRYLETHSAAAFAELVKCYIDLVHGTATRSLGGDRSLADDVTQAVFLLLSQKARSIRDAKALPSWLHQTTRYAAANAKRLRDRRKHHEQFAATRRSEVVMNDSTDESLLPHLDDAIASLATIDRQAVVARFLQGMSIAEVAEVMGTTSSAAQKRIERAIGKLQTFFIQRHFSITTSGVTSLLVISETHAAPASLLTMLISSKLSAATVSASAAGITNGTLSMMSWIKIKLVLICTAVVATGGLVVTTVAHLAKAQKSPIYPATSQTLPESKAEYQIHVGDMLDIQVDNLVGPNTVTQRMLRVSKTGKISMQLLPQPIQVEGLTEVQAQEAIKKAYNQAKIGVLQPSVAVIEKSSQVNGLSTPPSP